MNTTMSTNYYNDSKQYLDTIIISESEDNENEDSENSILEDFQIIDAEIIDYGISEDECEQTSRTSKLQRKHLTPTTAPDPSVSDTINYTKFSCIEIDCKKYPLYYENKNKVSREINPVKLVFTRKVGRKGSWCIRGASKKAKTNSAEKGGKKKDTVVKADPNTQILLNNKKVFKRDYNRAKKIHTSKRNDKETQKRKRNKISKSNDFANDRKMIYTCHHNSMKIDSMNGDDQSKKKSGIETNTTKYPEKSLKQTNNNAESKELNKNKQNKFYLGNTWQTKLIEINKDQQSHNIPEFSKDRVANKHASLICSLKIPFEKVSKIIKKRKVEASEKKDRHFNYNNIIQSIYNSNCEEVFPSDSLSINKNVSSNICNSILHCTDVVRRKPMPKSRRIKLDNLKNEQRIIDKKYNHNTAKHHLEKIKLSSNQVQQNPNKSLFIIDNKANENLETKSRKNSTFRNDLDVPKKCILNNEKVFTINENNEQTIVNNRTSNENIMKKIISSNVFIKSTYEEQITLQLDKAVLCTSVKVGNETLKGNLKEGRRRKPMPKSKRIELDSMIDSNTNKNAEKQQPDKLKLSFKGVHVNSISTNDNNENENLTSTKNHTTGSGLCMSKQSFSSNAKIFTVNETKELKLVKNIASYENVIENSNSLNVLNKTSCEAQTTSQPDKAILPSLVKSREDLVTGTEIPRASLYFMRNSIKNCCHTAVLKSNPSLDIDKNTTDSNIYENSDTKLTVSKKLRQVQKINSLTGSSDVTKSDEVADAFSGASSSELTLPQLINQLEESPEPQQHQFPIHTISTNRKQKNCYDIGNEYIPNSVSNTTYARNMSMQSNILRPQPNPNTHMKDTQMAANSLRNAYGNHISPSTNSLPPFSTIPQSLKYQNPFVHLLPITNGLNKPNYIYPTLHNVPQRMPFNNRNINLRGNYYKQNNYRQQCKVYARNNYQRFASRPPGISDVHPLNVHWAENNIPRTSPLLPLPFYKSSRDSIDESSVIERYNDKIINNMNITSPSTNNETIRNRELTKAGNFNGDASFSWHVKPEKHTTRPAESDKPVLSKTEMMDELDKSTFIGSPVKTELKKPCQFENSVDSPPSNKRYKPGPLSKKLQITYNVPVLSQNTEHATPPQQYSPPVLPIPTFETVLSEVQMATHEKLLLPPPSSLKRKCVENSSQAFVKKSASSGQSIKKRCKKISLDEYKKRITKNK